MMRTTRLWFIAILPFLVGLACSRSSYADWPVQIGTSSDDFGESVALDSSGNVIIGGHTNGSLATANAGSTDVFLNKYTISGTLVWSRQFGSSDADFASEVAVDPAGNSYAAGYTSGNLFRTNSGQRDAFVRKYDSSGTVQWSRQFGTTGDDIAYSITTDTSGNVFVSGSTTGTLAGPNPNNLSAFLRKYDGAGNELWTKQLADIRGYSVATDPAGNAYMTGYSGGGAFLAKYDTTGTLLWTSQLDSRAYAYAVAVDRNGNAYVSGQTDGYVAAPLAGGPYDAFLVKYDGSGVLQWKRQLGTSGDDRSQTVAVDTAGNAYVGGWTTGNLGGPNAGLTDAYVTKFSGSGSPLWTQQFGTPSADVAARIKVDNSGNTFVAGFTNGSFGPPGSQNAGGYDAFVARLPPQITAVAVDRTPSRTVVTQPAVPGGLKYFNVANSDWEDATAHINNQQPTIVLSHGWFGNPDAWPKDMAAALVANGVNANILAWDWHVGAQDVRATVAGSQALTEGFNLGQALVAALGTNYNLPLHFIGHSFGTRVDKVAADDVTSRLGVQYAQSNIQATVLDSAEIVLPGSNLVNMLLDPQGIGNPIPNHAAYVDNYITAFGAWSSQAANVVLFTDAQAGDPTVNLSTLHGFPIGWYTNTIRNPSASDLGYKWNITDGSLAGAPPAGSSYQLVSGLQVKPISEDYALSLLAIRSGQTGVRLIATAADTIEAPIQFVGNVTVAISRDTFGLLNLAFSINENSPAYAWVPIHVPVDAQFLSLKFALTGMSDADAFSVAIADNPLLWIQGNTVSAGVLTDSGLLDVSQWSGQDVELFLGLISDGSPGGQIAVQDIHFSAVPEPSALLLVLLAFPMIAFYRRALRRESVCKALSHNMQPCKRAT